MKIKKIVDTIDGMEAGLAGLYEKKADGKFHLQIEDDDTGPLLRAKEHEQGLRKIAEQERDTARGELDTMKAQVVRLQEDAGKDKNTIRDQLKEEYETRERKLAETHASEKAALEGTVKKVFVQDVAHRLAAELTDVPDLLIPLIERRLQVEVVNGEPVTRVLSADGKASAMTPDELRQEYFHDKRFERIIRGNNASGGGANGGHGGSGASKALKDLSEAERTQMAKDQPAEFQRLVDAEAKTA